jgi:GTP-binding protein HflX
LSWNSDEEIQQVAGRCLVLHPHVRMSNAQATSKGSPLRNQDGKLEEAVRLAKAIDLVIVKRKIVIVSRPKPATLLGSGAVERLQGIILQSDIDVVVVDGVLTPIQQRNLESTWEVKVIDRTGLILEIFGARARTKEGKLQVELAALSYQRSRLVRSWTHLERQRGGFGFMGGPGESQIESDRRMIDQRIIKLKRQLKEVRRTRELHRKARKRVPYSVVALVGYTNAGKSTLFNALSNADVVSEDQLFATLDPTMRSMRLPSGREVILSDTVGFISDLPHELVEAFRATLEEVQTANLLLHIRDISHDDTDAQKQDVDQVLKSLGVSSESDLLTANPVPLIEVLNKSDLLSTEEKVEKTSRSNRNPDGAVLVSSITGDGFDKLLKAIDKNLSKRRKEVKLKVSWEKGSLIAWLYERGEVVERRDKEKCVELKVRLEPEDIARFEQKYSQT